MFYAHFVLSKKGPLARVWLAAHWDKKLTKAHVFETSVENSVESIISPKVKMALRTSGHLLLGVVRIYSRKAKYLLADCNEAFVKIKMAFRPGMVDLPEENREAAASAITLPEVFHDFDTEIPDLNDIDVQAQFSLNQSRAEEITMREDYGNISLVHDDDFGGMAFDDREMLRGDGSTSLNSTLFHNDATDQAHMLLTGEVGGKDKDGLSRSDLEKPELGYDEPLHDDGFGGGVGEGLLSENLGGLFDEAPMPSLTGAVPHGGGGGGDDNRIPSPVGANCDSSDDDGPVGFDDDDDDFGSPPANKLPKVDDATKKDRPIAAAASNEHDDIFGPQNVDDVRKKQTVADQTTLVQNEEEAFALEPLDVTTVTGTERHRTKRKRKLIVDEIKGIDGEDMRSQLSSTNDIVSTLDLAPPTKKLMHWKETGGVEKLFALPGRAIFSKSAARLFTRHLTTSGTDDPEEWDLQDQLELDAAPAAPEIMRDELEQTRDDMRNSIAGSTMLDDTKQSSVRQAAEQEKPVASPETLPKNLKIRKRPWTCVIGSVAPESDYYAVGVATPYTPGPMTPGNVDLGLDDLEVPPELQDLQQELQLEAEQQQEGETAEEFEERQLNRRTQHMMHMLQKTLSKQSDVGFFEMTVGHTRKQAAAKFYTLLVLKKSQAVEVVQHEPYEDIIVSKGVKFVEALA